MGSIAKDRLVEIDKYNNTLLKRKIRFSNGEYRTIEDYLIEVYPDNMDFYADKIGPMLESRAQEAEKTYNDFLNDIITKNFTDEKYTTPIRKDENWYMSFVEYLKSMPIGSVKEDRVKYGLGTVSLDELFEKFSKDVYVEMDPEMKDLQEPSLEEQKRALKQHMTGQKLEEIIANRGLNRDDIVNNTHLNDKIMNEYVDSIIDFDQAYADGSLVDGLNNIINNEYIMVQKSDDVKKLEESTVEPTKPTPVSQIDEIIPTQFGVSTNKTDLLITSEINALINPDLTYAEQQKVEPIVMSGPGDDDETVVEANDGVEEIPASLDKIQEEIKMRS